MASYRGAEGIPIPRPRVVGGGVKLPTVLCIERCSVGTELAVSNEVLVTGISGRRAVVGGVVHLRAHVVRICCVIRARE